MLILAGVAAAAACCSCSHKTAAPVADAARPQTVASPETSFIPKASAFKMSGPYADKVAVTLANGRLSYYPAPSDISDASKPLYLGNGWWLNNQGLSANSVFTSWTFDEYARLSATPSQEEIMSHIIPDAYVTDFRRTTVPVTEAASRLSQIKSELY